ncbi:Homeodomain-like protein [Lipomyces arxii]|uniref:Homeodomain-like protein n=1 Tax=Lipomyces arxii TaxID=56418 RepID=UPI0034CECB1F
MSHRRGPWSSAEDTRLIQLINAHGPTNWVRISQLLSTRTAKQCRERYHQNLKPSLNHAPISDEEGLLIEQLVSQLGKKWAEIARHLSGRSDNAVKNWWNGGANRRRRAGSDDIEDTDDGGRDNRRKKMHLPPLQLHQQMQPQQQQPYRQRTYLPPPPLDTPPLVADTVDHGELGEDRFASSSEDDDYLRQCSGPYYTTHSRPAYSNFAYTTTNLPRSPIPSPQYKHSLEAQYKASLSGLIDAPQSVPMSMSALNQYRVASLSTPQSMPVTVQHLPNITMQMPNQMYYMQNPIGSAVDEQRTRAQRMNINSLLM